MKISITGDLGSGKSTVGKLLATTYNLEFISTGQIQRELAKSLGISILELNLSAEKTASIDTELDQKTQQLGKTQDNFIIDSRMAWHFIPDSFKVYLRVDPVISAQRVLQDVSRKSEDYDSIDEAVELIQKRRNSESARFRSLYNVDCGKLSEYDLVIDTSYTSPELVAAKVLESFEAWKSNQEYTKLWVSPKVVYPTHSVRQLGSEVAQQLCDSVSTRGYSENHPAELLLSNSHFFIYDGHKRISAALFSENISLIPAKILAEGMEEVLHFYALKVPIVHNGNESE